MEIGQIIIRVIFGLFFLIMSDVTIKFIINTYNIPVHRLIKYRIVKRHTTFDCLGKVGEYYKYYIQEKHFFQWNDIVDRDIPLRKDGELLYSKKQRQDNYFETFKNANICLQNLIKKRELEYQIKKLKQDDQVIKTEEK